MKPSAKNPDPGHLTNAFLELYNLIVRLRGPDGCPWDRAQTPESMRANLVEEAYECVEAIDERNAAHLREELGDLFLIMILIAHMYEETGEFSLDEVFQEISAKLIRRHPHVFAGEKADSIPEIKKNWDYIKEHIEGKKKKAGIYADLNNALPPLGKAHAIQKKAAKIGFDWSSAEPVYDKIEEETRELKEAVRQQEISDIENEVGDLLFTIVNLARHLKVDPSLALEHTNRKFVSRFRRLEAMMKNMKLTFSQMNLEQMDTLWEKAKQEKQPD